MLQGFPKALEANSEPISVSALCNCQVCLMCCVHRQPDLRVWDRAVAEGQGGGVCNVCFSIIEDSVLCDARH